MGAQSPQLGYNHNIPHRGRLYHVQTEDSGVDKAHIFTHVFYDGTIISSNKVDYRDKLNATDEPIDPLVIGLMQESHKSMIKRLRRREFDDKIFSLLGAHPDEEEAAAPEPAADATPDDIKISKPEIAP